VWELGPPHIDLLPSDDNENNENGKSCIGTGTIYGEAAASYVVCLLTTSNPDTMVYALSKFITLPSVSSDPLRKEDCRQAGIWLKKCLGQLGAHTALVCCITLVEFSSAILHSYQLAKVKGVILSCSQPSKVPHTRSVDIA